MKKEFLCLMIAVLLLPICGGCAPSAPEKENEMTKETGEATTAPNNEMPQETSEVITAPDEDESLGIWYVHSFTKTDPDKPTDTGMHSYTVYLAKNETEDAQIVLSSENARRGLLISCTPLRNGNGDEIPVKIYREYYVECGSQAEYSVKWGNQTYYQTNYPDPLKPTTYADMFDIEAGRSQTLFIQLKTGKDTPAGDYEGVVSVHEGGNTVRQLRLFAHVWDFGMPEVMTASAVTGLWTDQIARFHGSGGGKDYYKEYYDFLLDYHMNAYDLPYDILDERADAYMSDPRVRYFCLPYVEDDERMTAMYDKLKSNGEWFEKAYFYPYDEPNTHEALDQMAEKCACIKQLCPGIKIVVPFFKDVQYDSERDQIAFMSEYVDIWCPKLFCFTKLEDKGKGKQLLYNSLQTKAYSEFGERMQAEVAGGDELWWYVCWEPGLPYLNMFVDMTGLQNKLIFWQQKQYNVDGFLYWACNHWGNVEDPWTSMRTVGPNWQTGQPGISDTVYGDGSLLYPGSIKGIDGPCGSFRLVMIRDGIEEYEMLTMLEASAGREKTDEIIGTVSENLVRYTDDEDVMANARIALGNALEVALQGGPAE